MMVYLDGYAELVVVTSPTGTDVHGVLHGPPTAATQHRPMLGRSDPRAKSGGLPQARRRGEIKTVDYVQLELGLTIGIAGAEDRAQRSQYRANLDDPPIANLRVPFRQQDPDEARKTLHHAHQLCGIVHDRQILNLEPTA